MRSTIILTIMVFYAFICGAQTGNPFDIGPVDQVSPIRSIQLTTIDTASAPIEAEEIIPSSNNPFDINKGSVSPDIPTVENEVEATTTSLISSGAKQDPSEIITLIYIIVALCLLTFAISLNRSRFASILKSLFNSNFLKNLYKENRAWTDLQSIVLYGLFSSNAAYLLYLLNHHYLEGVLPGVFILLLIIVVVYLVRHLTMAYISSVYNLRQEVGLHNFSIGLHNMILGVVLIPFIMGIGFVSGGVVKIAAYVLLGLVVVFYALRQIKGGLSIITSRDFNVFYFFIYLCAVEIAPILVTWKVVSGVF